MERTHSGFGMVPEKHSAGTSGTLKFDFFLKFC